MERKLLASVTPSGGGGGDELDAGAAAARQAGAAHRGAAGAAEAVPHGAHSPAHAQVAASSVARSHRCPGHGCEKEKGKLSVLWALAPWRRDALTLKSRNCV